MPFFVMFAIFLDAYLGDNKCLPETVFQHEEYVFWTANFMFCLPASLFFCRYLFCKRFLYLSFAIKK